MDDAVNTLRGLLDKASAKIEKAQKALEIAKNEHSDYETALRVMLSLRGESLPQAKGDSPSGASKSVSHRQAIILDLLPLPLEAPLPPLDLWEAYKKVGDDVSLDTFRTTIWRMSAEGNCHVDKNGSFWRVLRAEGRYSKQPVVMAVDDLIG